MFESFRVDRRNISDTVVDYLKNLIYEGKFAPGERIPGERELAQLMNVSRNTIRESFKILAAQGYLNIKHGNGVFVADADTQLAKITSAFFVKHDHIIELFAIRKVLETQAVEWAIKHVDSACEAELTHMLADSRRALKAGDYAALARLDHKFHLALTRMSGNSVLHRIMLHLIDLLGEARNESIRIPDRAAQSIKEHGKIVDSIILRDADTAKQLMLDHLNSVEKSIIRQKQIERE
ncbi:FadR/GntR family transcriptional regulator [Brevibacillus massiliensis]|jgi:GntR family transcriptional repressor for pyruvate dehydrogenase complex|uniref:FadR/GntR family transcriptional regulator n=1 Tax=Brevibacillus massiliensis TaxID=1118054 RepID=UPI0003000C6A|nr:FadR/GntR family transcriptional regulator [Brevibacillus massiliensis]